MANKIQVDYPLLEKSGKTFDQQAQVVDQMMRRLRGRLEPLKAGGWVGPDADKFFAQMDVLLVRLARLQDALASSGQSSKKISKEMYQADEAAKAALKIF